jgi:antibiotic biosynthesis monooxygenase (ABM) superfamily enzyme
MVPTLPMLHPRLFTPIGNLLPSIFSVHYFSLLTTSLMVYFVNPLAYKREQMWKNEREPT